MRLGSPLFTAFETPAQWVAAVHALGHNAAYCPVEPDASDETVAAYAAAAEEADIVIAEVGAWGNPLSPDPATAAAAFEKCVASLSLADRIGARCCVNIAGSCGPKWDGPDPGDLTDVAFDRVVASVQSIIDAVRPTRTSYTLEVMPWMHPDSADAYLALLEAVDRPAFAVHFDPVNLICSPRLYFDNANVIRDFVAKLGPHIRSCHAKDVLLGEGFTVHLDEVRPGLGRLDHATLLRELAKLPQDVPVLLEHLNTEKEYAAGTRHLLAVAEAEGL